MKVEYFLTIFRTNYFTERVYEWRKNLSDRWKKNLKEIRGSWIFEKVWLKAAKSVSEKWILLKFVRETRTKPPYLPSKVVHLVLRSYTRRRKDL